MRPSERLLLWLVVGAAALTVDKIVIADCRLTSTATIPVNDLGRRSYNGVVGGRVGIPDAEADDVDARGRLGRDLALQLGE